MAGLPALSSIRPPTSSSFCLSGTQPPRLDVIVEITVNNVKMTRPIEDLVFYEK
jgi:hypothetical protein